MKFDTKNSDIEVLIQFAKDQGFDIPEVTRAAKRLEDAIALDLQDYYYPKEPQ